MAKKEQANNPDNPEAEWFGYDRVSPEDKTDRVRGVFDSVASRYDVMNDLMSLGLHRAWKAKFVSRLRPRAGQKILDVAGGTGDISMRCALKTKGMADITVCDINPNMLAVGRDRAVDRGWLPEQIKWVTGNAEALPFPSRSFDTVCIAFGLRNVTRIDVALAEFARVLKPGGRFFCMEFSPGMPKGLKNIYDIYSFAIIPMLGEAVAKDRASYQYLAESIRQFPLQPVLAKRMEKAGFEHVGWENLMGGIVAIHEGWKL